MTLLNKIVRKLRRLVAFTVNEHPYAPVNMLLGNDMPQNFWKQYYRNEYLHTFKKTVLDTPILGRPVIINVGCKDAREMRDRSMVSNWCRYSCF